MFVDVAYAMGSGEGNGGGGIMDFLLPFVIIILVFYFLIIMPQRRQAKKRREMLELMKKGDTIITSGLDGVFPKGLRIGSVSSVDKRNAGMFQDIAVKLYVDFEGLEEVLILLNEPAYADKDTP